MVMEEEEPLSWKDAHDGEGWRGTSFPTRDL